MRVYNLNKLSIHVAKYMLNCIKSRKIALHIACQKSKYQLIADTKWIPGTYLDSR
jgi:hypothetical protein